MAENSIPWKCIAKGITDEEKSFAKLNNPKPTGIILSWKQGFYLGSIQEIVPDVSTEIVLLSKTDENILPAPLVDEFRKLKRLELVADDSLCLTGRQHILRRLGNRLTLMTPEQMDYMLMHPIGITEI